MLPRSTFQLPGLRWCFTEQEETVSHENLAAALDVMEAGDSESHLDTIAEAIQLQLAANMTAGSWQRKREG